MNEKEEFIKAFDEIMKEKDDIAVEEVPVKKKKKFKIWKLFIFLIILVLITFISYIYIIVLNPKVIVATELANSMSLGKFNSVLGGDYDTYLTFDEQITAYGQLSAELTRYLLAAGCTNIKSATFLSEPGNGWKGSNWLDTKLQSPQLNFETAIEAYDKCAKSVQAEFVKNNVKLG